jgi:hypothetical protein
MGAFARVVIPRATSSDCSKGAESAIVTADKEVGNYRMRLALTITLSKEYRRVLLMITGWRAF